MKRLLTLLFTLFLIPAVFADKESMLIFKKNTQETIDFLNNEQNKEIFSTVKYTLPVKGVYDDKAYASKQVKKAFVPQKYDFSNKTSYGDFKVLVFEESANTFKISFSSEYPIQLFQLMDSNTKNIAVKEELNDVNSYSCVLNRAFEPKYILLLSMYKDGIISQNIIPLYKKANVKYK